MISPTGLGVRSDEEGDGAWGSKRTAGAHKGVDFICHPYQDIVAPTDMIIQRIARPYVGTSLSGIAWRSETMAGKMFYFLPYIRLIGRPVREGQVIGTAQDVSLEYDPGMTPHVHMQIDSIDVMALINLTEATRRL